MAQVLLAGTDAVAYASQHRPAPAMNVGPIRRFLGGGAFRAWPWMLVIYAVAPSVARAAKPSISFIGVHDATGNDVRSHRVEQLFVDALRKASKLDSKLPADLDLTLGAEVRLEILHSQAPELRVVQHREQLEEDVLFVTITPDPSTLAGPDLAVAHVLNASRGSELFALPIGTLDEVGTAAVVQELVSRLVPDSPEDVQLTYMPRERAPADVPVVLTASLLATGQVYLSLIFRRDDEVAWHDPVDLIRSDGTHYVGALPPMHAGKLLYYIQATDADLKVLASSGSEDRPHILVLEEVKRGGAPPHTAAYASFALAGAAAVTGVVFLIRTYDAAARNQACATATSCNSGLAAVRAQDGVMWGSFGFAAAFAGAGGLLYVKTAF